MGMPRSPKKRKPERSNWLRSIARLFDAEEEADMNDLDRYIKKRKKTDPDFAQRVRRGIPRLQDWCDPQAGPGGSRLDPGGAR